MYLIRVRDEFCAAHALTFADGTRERLHGHNWRVEVVVACPQLDAQGLGMDFVAVQQVLHALLDEELDHRNLNDIADLPQPNATSERLARWIAERLAARLPAGAPGAHLQSVTVWESDDCGVTYEMEQQPT